MSNSLMNSTTQIDNTLTKDGYAADSKTVGDKLNEAKLVVKGEKYTMTTDEYAQIEIPLPEDFVALSYIQCNNALLCIQDSSNNQLGVRCFGQLVNVQLYGLRNTTLTIYLYYLAKSTN